MTEDSGTSRILFTQHFLGGVEYVPGDHFGSDLPGGPTLPWRPGFLSGFHLMFDTLRLHLEGRRPSLEEADLRWREELVPRYREHIAALAGTI
jgi:hypothetical protein